MALFNSTIFNSAVFNTGGSSPIPDPDGCAILLQSGYKITKESGDGALLLTNCVISVPAGTGCDILLQSGFSILKQDGDKLLLTNCAIGEDFVGHGDYLSWHSNIYKYEYEQAKKREKIKQAEVIRLRLEAQEALLRKQELVKAAQDKQTQRQLKALQAEYDALMEELAYQLNALEELQKATAKRKRMVLTLLLMAASPFSPVTF